MCIRDSNWITRLNGDLCYLQVSYFTPGPHTITFKNVGNVNVGANVPLAWGAVLRGASPVGTNRNDADGYASKRTDINRYGEITGETNTFPASVVSPQPDAILLSRSHLWAHGAGTGSGAWCDLQGAPNGTTVWEFPAQYDMDGRKVVSEMPWQIQRFTSATTVNMPSGTFGFLLPRNDNVVQQTSTGFWVFYEEDYYGGGGPDAEITGVTQVGAYVESDDTGDGGEDGAMATRITQAGAYVEGAKTGTGADGALATGVTQIGGYIEAATSEGTDATAVTQIGLYIEAVIDPNYSAALVRISQAFTLVEARRVTITPAPPPATGDIPSRLPEYQQAPPVPFNPLDLPKVSTPTVSMPLLPQKGPVPFGPIQWMAMPTPQPVSLPSLPESEPVQQYDPPSSGRGDILGITKARVSRSILMDALAATFDAQSIPVKGAAIGPNLALVNGVPAQTTEISPIAGRTATYTNIGRASMAVYAPEVQTPAAQKVNSATAATPTIVLPPASPTTRINVIYPLLGGGALSADLTIVIDEIGYQATIAAVLDAIMQSTVTIGYEEGAAPNTINLYVMPGTIDAATLDGLTVPELRLIGSAGGQILRYNETEAQWRPASEPLDFKGLNLSTDEPPDQHGGFRYNPLTKHLETVSYTHLTLPTSDLV